MAKLEVPTVVASSLDNFLIFSNDSYQKPYVQFECEIASDQEDITITITNADDETEFKKTIVGTASGDVTSSSFNLTSSDDSQVVLSLMECLRLNSIFYGVTLVDLGSNQIAVRAYVETSRHYSIVSSDSQIVVYGSYSYYDVETPNKFVLMEKSDKFGDITMQKYSTSNEVSFNVTSPFQHISMKFPTKIQMLAYQTANKVSDLLSISNSTIYVLPTTLSKFQEFDYLDYFCYSELYNSVKFLTNNYERNYNYGEVCALSVLSNGNPSLIKKYYTNSGVFLSADTTIVLSEINNMRKDFYFKMNLDGVEAYVGQEVGYVEVSAVLGSNEVTTPVRYNVIPKCNDNHTLFFVNEIGGIDSFTFLGETIRNTSIDDESTYFINPTRPYTTKYELEYSKMKRNSIVTTLTTTIQDKRTAEWLNELSKSKYVFKFDNNSSPSEMLVIVEKMDIETSDRQTEFEVQLSYHDADNKIEI